MAFPERFSNLPDYAFPRLRSLLGEEAPGCDPVDMTIGAPRHPFPDFVGEVLAAHLDGFGVYPPNPGSDAHLAAITGWVRRRYGVALDPDSEVIALNGTREGLYNAAMALCPETKAGARPVVLIPNPFYQVYAVAALSVAAEPVYVPATRKTGHLPDYAALAPDILDRTAIAYVCSPANPQGSVADASYWQTLLALAERHDFRVLADECYAEIYRDTPPAGILPAARDAGADPERVVAFHSLSKRSNVPGLRAGFAAGGADCIARMRQLRNYAGAPLPLPLQAVAARLWDDEAYVVRNRALYAAKYRAADALFADIEGFDTPKAGFFLWLPVPDRFADGEAAACALWREAGVKVLPGAYLGRDTGAGNPGDGYVRVAMVALEEETRRGLQRVRSVLYG